MQYNELQASGGNFDTLANRRIDEIRRPGDKDQFHKERAAEQQKAKGTPGAPGGGLDAECQRRRQSESEERQDYSHQHDEEIRFREGGTPSPMTYNSIFAIKGHPWSPHQEEDHLGGISIQAIVS